MAEENLSLICSNCQHEICYPAHHADMKTKCPRCKTIVLFPAIEEAQRAPNTSARLQFSVKGVVLAVTTCAFLIQVVLVKKSFIVYLPIFAIGVFAYAAIAGLHTSRSHKLPFLFHNYRRFFLYLTLAIVATALFFPVARYLIVEMNQAQQESRYRKSALAMRAPDQFKAACLDLHRQIMSQSPSDRMLIGTSSNVPPPIRKMKPMLIIADDDFLFVKLTRNNSGIAAYIPTSKRVPHSSNPAATKIVDDLYFWQNESPTIKKSTTTFVNTTARPNAANNVNTSNKK